MIAVKFNVVPEFCEELKKQARTIPDKIVRLTNSVKASSLSPSIRHMSLIATFLTELPNSQVAIVRLEHYCGDLWGISRDEEVKTKAEKLAAEVEAACKALGLEVRAGVYEDVPAPAAR